jgi:hypothetical protein
VSVDRPFVGGGKVKEMPGTCERCTWGRGEHAADCPQRPIGCAECGSANVLEKWGDKFYCERHMTTDGWLSMQFHRNGKRFLGEMGISSSDWSRICGVAQ